MTSVQLTPEERARMEATHQPGVSIVKRAGEEPTPVCMGCGMDWPCPGRRLLDLPTSPRPLPSAPSREDLEAEYDLFCGMKVSRPERVVQDGHYAGLRAVYELGRQGWPLGRPRDTEEPWTPKELLDEVARSHRMVRDAMRSVFRPDNVPNCSCEFCEAFYKTLPTLEEVRGIFCDDAARSPSPTGQPHD
jgi:hypothetical protein